MKKLLSVLVFLLFPAFMCSNCFSNDIPTDMRIISGTVVDTDGEPIHGVTVVVSGTTLGTLTDFFGQYSITAHRTNTLKFSLVGYESQSFLVSTLKPVDKEGKVTLNVILEEIIQIEDEQ